MRHEHFGGAEIDYQLCRYGGSKILFRGPRKSLRDRYIAFVGSSEFYGKSLVHPLPSLVEDEVSLPCVNLGCVNASIDAFLRETTVHEVCKGSALNIVQVMGAQNMSNRFYTVHPRRNHRFLRASSVMRAIYPEVDFTEFSANRQMLHQLYRLSPERFEIIQTELQMAWRARMKTFIGEIGSHTLLLWFAEHLPSDAHLEDRPDPIHMDPLFVTRSMIDELRREVQGVIIAQPPSDAKRSLAKGESAQVNLLLEEPSQEAAASVVSDAVKRTLHMA